MPLRIKQNNSNFTKKLHFFAKHENILGFDFYFNSNVFYVLLSNFLPKTKIPDLSSHFLVFCALFVLQKSNFYYPIIFVKSPFPVIEVTNHVIVKSWQMMTSLAKNGTILFYYVHMIFKKV